MERPTFFRAADDLDLMAPLSDLSDDDLATPCAARSMALMAKKRGLAQKQPEAPKPARSGRQLWADITTDDEDNFPAWPPAPKAAPVTTAPEVKISETKGDELLWDPIGLGSSESYLTDLLYHKTQTKTSGAGTVFDKWSWSTAATDSPDSTLEDFQADDEDQTPQVEAVQSVQMPVGRQPAQLPSFQLQIQPTQPLQQPMQPLPLQMQQPHLQTQPMAMVPVQMQQDIPQATTPGMLLAVPYPMPMDWQKKMSMGMGMLPMVMSTTGHQATVAAPEGPPMGTTHRFHQKNSNMGMLSSDARTFTKKYNKGRLSIVSENKVHFQGTVRYSLQFTEGELCSADGVGFILSSDLPCTRNIQKIISVFVNRTGRICIRVHDEVVRCSRRVKELDVGDWLEVSADLVNQSVSFTVWPQDKSQPSFATVSFKEVLENARGRVNGVPRNPCGFLAVVIKHVGVSVQLAS